MNRSRYWLHLAFWLSLLLTIALNLLNAETRGGITDGDGSMRHLFAMAATLIPLAVLVYRRAWDAGLSAWMSALAVPASAMLFPFVLMGLGLAQTSDRRESTPKVSLWWMLPALLAGIGLGALLSLMLR